VQGCSERESHASVNAGLEDLATFYEEVMRQHANAEVTADEPGEGLTGLHFI
jgi:hypothetical protein